MFIVVNEANVVCDIFESKPELHESITLVEVPDNTVSIGDTYNTDGTFTPCEPIVEIDGSDYKAMLSDKRYQEEISGIIYKGKEVSTNRDSQTAIANAYIYSLQNPDLVVQWKCKDGFIELNATEITELSSNVRTHIQNCFNKELEILTHIDNGTFTEDMLTNW